MEKGQINPGPGDQQAEKEKDKEAQQTDSSGSSGGSGLVNFVKTHILARKPEGEGEEGRQARKPKGSRIDRLIDTHCENNPWCGASCLKVFKVFIKCFTMTFIAEWGDRSQLATIVLAGLNNVWGVILGGCAGHTVCTAAAVLVGMIVAKFISARVITFIGALVFIGFAIASIFMDPNANIDDIPDIPVKSLDIFKCLNYLPTSQGYDNCTRWLNHNLKLTLEMENV